MSNQSTYGIGLPVWVTITAPDPGSQWPEPHRWHFNIGVDLAEMGVAIRKEGSVHEDQDPPPDDKMAAAIERFIEASDGGLVWEQTVFLPDQPPRPVGDPNRMAENYPRAVELAADSQGITRIVEAWRKEGLDALSEQTGGFTMVATIYGKAGIIQANAEGYTVTYTALDRYNADDYDSAVVVDCADLQSMATVAKMMVAMDRILAANITPHVENLAQVLGSAGLDDLEEAMTKEPLQ